VIGAGPALGCRGSLVSVAAMALGGWRWARKALAAGRPLFQGRALLLTNTLGCGVLMAAGDGARQVWEVRARPGQRFSARRSGERDLCANERDPQRPSGHLDRAPTFLGPVNHSGTWHPL
jgi:hypothetical protein